MSSEKTCQHPQLCAIAKELMNLDDSIEWKEAIKDRVQTLGYPRPTSREVVKAMDAVETAQPRQKSKQSTYGGPIEQPLIVPETVASLHPSIRELFGPALKRLVGK